ncbi:Type II inositol 3,4-bisphosphate 4-phosphatase [Varanus komodoensis]|nr:Type II inositol 3,4-bisphosphate 4-phosphatase [Varanus komodoensis]
MNEQTQLIQGSKSECLVVSVSLQSCEASELVILERCCIVEFRNKADVSVVLKFQSGEPDLYLEAASRSDCASWAVALGKANSEGLRNKIQQLQRLIMEIKEEKTADEVQQFLLSAPADNLAEPKITSLKRSVIEPKLEFSLGGLLGFVFTGIFLLSFPLPSHPVPFPACKDLVAPTRDRKLNTFVQITVVHPGEQNSTRYASTEIVEGTRDPLFLTGVTFPSDYPICEETKIKLTVYDVKDKSQDTLFAMLHRDMPAESKIIPHSGRKRPKGVRTSILSENKDPRTDIARSFLGCATFKVGELVKSKEKQLTLSLRSSDGGKTFGTIDVSFVKMGETEDGEADHSTTDVQGQKCALVYECTSLENANSKDNLPLFNAVLKNPICKFYRFPTSDNKWMCVREQMSESTLSFHIPKELINLHIKEDMRR